MKLEILIKALDQLCKNCHHYHTTCFINPDSYKDIALQRVIFEPTKLYCINSTNHCKEMKFESVRY